MKQLYIYFGILLALLLLPGGTDAAKLAPAQVVYVQVQGDEIIVRTDMENEGRGADLKEAFDDLENTTSGKVFLDTADYLLVDEASMGYLQELTEWLKGTCLVCKAENVENLLDAAIYLEAHPPGQKLKDCRFGSNALPILTENDGRFCLKG